MSSNDPQILLSMPPAGAAAAPSVLGSEPFVASDPPGRQLGSGGGTAHLLLCAWQETARGRPFWHWMTDRKRILIHGSGESRRLPAYAPCGKPFVPVPFVHSLSAQVPGQTLFDLQARFCRSLLRLDPAQSRLLVACGDVLIHAGRWIPPIPMQAEIVILGIPASPEEAAHHGVMFCQAGCQGEVSFFLQKPTADRIRQAAASHDAYLDTGVWLLSERAARVLLHKSGLDGEPSGSACRDLRPYDLYGEMGPALGSSPQQSDPDVSPLSCAVVPLPEGTFFHFGTNRSLLASSRQLRTPESSRRSVGHASWGAGAAIVNDAEVLCPLSPANNDVWIDNATVGRGWQLSERHVITGVPPNDWNVRFPPGACLDFVPMRNGRFCVRNYGFDDAFRGRMDSPETLWMERPATAWLQTRGISMEEAGIRNEDDIHKVPLFVVCDPRSIEEGFLTWLLASSPEADGQHRAFWLGSPRCSAAQLLTDADAGRHLATRRERALSAVGRMDPDVWGRFLCQTDLAFAAPWMLGETGTAPPPTPACGRESPVLTQVHEAMLRAELVRVSAPPEAERFHAQSIELLRRAMVEPMELRPVAPRRTTLDDQIVWGRSPIRLDIAGGWTDTPPYCIEHGGQVVNLAVDLNGQPPIQVFARLGSRPVIALHSIDQGRTEEIAEFGQLERFSGLGSSFGIARAALCLCGLSPRFHAGRACANLAGQLRGELRAGIEISVLAAVPKGSGLGTSSILAATLLGTLSELLGLQWSADDVCARTLALEQMLTSGGGWQDQIGGLFGGAKLITSAPALPQRPVLHWLPDSLFTGPDGRGRMLLYYTGITRVAHNILGEIVRGLFLNSTRHVPVIEDIGSTALFAADAIQRNSWAGLCEAVRRSWVLNQDLDAGTNPPAVQAILGRIGDLADAYKLLGAGGGGYLLILAKSAESALRIRRTLSESPPNAGARFVDFAVSKTGLRVTRS